VRVDYKPFLQAAHDRLHPSAYLEIGIDKGYSLALSRCPSIGIDPGFNVLAELHCEVALMRTSSDEYFTRPEPLGPTGGVPFDLTFIDGLHLFEFALRDFINAERHSSPRALHIIDDVLPNSVDEAARDRHTGFWTGDVYWMLPVLHEYRPDLLVLPVSTTPTGMLLVFGCDRGSTVLSDRYTEIMARFRRPDPQVIPQDLLDRTSTVTPERVLSSRIFEVLADREIPLPDLRAALADEVVKLGQGFVASPA